MRPRTRLFWFSLCALCLAPASGHALTRPAAFLGFNVGADRKLAGYPDIVRYLETLDRESPRLQLERLGKTTLGRDMVMAVITSERNMGSLEAIRTTARRLADPRGVEPGAAAQLIAQGKTVVLVTCNIHSSEIGASQMAMEWAHDLCASDDARVTRWLDDVVLLLMPSINPDGTDMIVDYYKRFVGTEWEGGRLPWLYHHYAGHDNNRDWFMLNLVETRMVNRVLHHEWFPQVFLDMHQMGAGQPRIFVPPYADPHTPLVHPLQWRLNDLIGTHMALRLEEKSKSGVINSFAYDAYWPGGTKNTACLKNVIGLLTEVSSCRIASPVYVDPNELQGGRKGLPEYKAQMNYPNPWPGGWWRLRDIVDYELIAGNSLIETCSSFREEILRSCYEMARDAVDRGTREAPFAYVIPPDQHDASAARRMVELLREHGLEARTATSEFTTADGRRFPGGSVVFAAAQPYRPFLIEMMERQRYPEVRQGPDTREIFRPYDVTAWTLPLLMGVEWARVDQPFEATYAPAFTPAVAANLAPVDVAALVLPAESNLSFAIVNRLLAAGVAVDRAMDPLEVRAGPSTRRLAPGAFIVPRESRALVERLARERGVEVYGYPSAARNGRRAKLSAVRVGLYKPWAASMDEGWTRLVFDTHDFKYANLDNAAMKQKNLRQRFDVIVLPDVEKDIIVEGRARGEDAGYFEPLPPAYAGGIGKEGVAALKDFVTQGGTLVCLTSSSDLAIAEFNIPVRDLVAKARPSEFSIPGTLVNLEVDTTHPLAWGMPPTCAAYSTGGPVFGTSIPGAQVGRSVVARYPQYPDQVVASGWAKGTELVTGRGAIVEARLERGKVIMLGPRVQHRAQMVGTYKFLFNAILGAGMKAEGEIASR